MALSPHLTRTSLLLSLLLLAPRVGFAQEQTSQPASEAPAAQEEAPKAREDAPTAMQPARTADAPLPGSGERPKMRLAPERPPEAARVSAELGAALLTGLGGGFLGFMSTWAIFSSFSGVSTLALAAPTLVGIGLGVSIGTYWGGQAAGGESDFGGPLLGTLLGGAAGMLLGIANPLAALVLTPVFMVVGSIIGYETADEGDTAPVRRVQPLLSVSPRGAVVGLAAVF